MTKRQSKTVDRANLLFDMLLAAGPDGLSSAQILESAGWTKSQFGVAKDIIREELASIRKEPIIYNPREDVWKIDAPKDEVKEFVHKRQEIKARQILNDLTAAVVPYLAKHKNRDVAMKYAERSLRRAVEDLQDVL